jgi:hypothetical protein
MEIITIEKRAFEAMIVKFKDMVERIQKLCPPKNELEKEWMDNQEVCQLLDISKRTLQYYRNSGKISHTQIGYKNFYKAADIEKMLKELESKNHN